MTTQPNTPTDEHVQHAGATRRLRWKTVFAVPLVLGCSLLSTCAIAPNGDPTGDQPPNPEYEREVLVILNGK